MPEPAHAHAAACWVCGGPVAPWLALGGRPPTRSEDVRITDANYGQAADLVRCGSCGFLQADGLGDTPVTSLYEDLSDPGYVDGEAYRLRQMRRLVRSLLPRCPGARSLLDVGAGTGLLAQAATDEGLEAVGVEPSRSLAAAGRALGRDVRQGVLPHPSLAGRRFDLVTLVDVIEHVTDPVGLLVAARDHLADGGTLVVTTPDVEALAPRLLGRRWWHYRAAHVCFLPTSAMGEAARRAGLSVRGRERQVWWFSADYLGARLGALAAGPRVGARLERALARTPLRSVVLPLNTFDSWVYTLRADGGAP
jgi:SAM-dependent methyltransferase